MNLLDWIIIAYAALGALSGFRRGFVALAISLAGYILAYMAARAYYQPVDRYLNSHYHLAAKIASAGHNTSFAATAGSDIVSALSFLAILVVVEVVVSVIAGGFSARRLKIPVIGLANRLMGLVLGTGEHLFIATLALIVLAPFIGQTHSFLGQWEQNSQLYQHVMRQWMVPFGSLHG